MAGEASVCASDGSRVVMAKDSGTSSRTWDRVQLERGWTASIRAGITNQLTADGQTTKLSQTTSDAFSILTVMVRRSSASCSVIVH
jgi:hypothetical protein